MRERGLRTLIAEARNQQNDNRGTHCDSVTRAKELHRTVVLHDSEAIEKGFLKVEEKKSPVEKF